MNKLVYSVFKAIMTSIIFIFVFDMGFYLYRAVSINARMESLSTSLKKVVMENNYLPKEDARLFGNLLGQMVADFNHCDYSISGTGRLTFTDSNINDNFVSGLHWNYGTSAVFSSTPSDLMSLTSKIYKYNGSSWVEQNRKIVETDMSKPREYGDIQVVQLRVGIYQPLWGWFSAGSSPSKVDYNYNGEDGTMWNRAAITTRGTEFTYTYYVPCLKYKSTNTY